MKVIIMATKSTRNNNKPWTPSEIAKLNKLAKGNTPTRVIGLELGRTENAIYSKAHGLLCLADGFYAENMTATLYKNTFLYHNDNADAYRHSLWNALTTYHTSKSFAKQFADAHESESTIALETSMDLYNNNQGRIVGSGNYNVANGDSYNVRLIVQDVKSAVSSGTMKRFCWI